MKPLKITSFLVLFFFGFIVSGLSQNITEKPADVFLKIDRDYKEGRLTLDKKIRYKFYASQGKTNKLPSSYQENSSGPLKCATPASVDLHKHRDKLSKSTLKELEIEQSATSQETYESHVSESGNFEIRYNVTGDHAVPAEDTSGSGIPDYVEAVAAAADSSYRHQVQTLGYSDPIISGTPYVIEIRNLEYFYGQTIPNGSTTYIQMENDFSEGFPPNDDPDGHQAGAIKVTVAHEFKHAIQYQAAGWEGETGGWLEMDATLMEEVVYDNVNDYYNYLHDSSSIFSNPGNSFYPGSYYHASWALYFEEKYGPKFWPQVWDIIKNDPDITLVDAISRQLGGKNAFKKAYTESQLWHYASGENTTPGFGFTEATSYPTPRSNERQNLFSENFSIPRSQLHSKINSLVQFSAQYIDVPVPENITGNISLEIQGNDSYQGLGIIAYDADGEIIDSTIYASQEQKFITSDIRFEDAEKLALIFTNFSTSEVTSRKIVAIGTDIENPQSITLNNNYPNPFSNTTNIRFTVDKQARVSLKVYDVTGRLVQTLIDDELEPRMYEPTFDGSGLASGVYLYQLLADDQMFIQKMTLIK